MVGELKTIRFTYTGKVELEETLKNKIMDNWLEIKKKTDLYRDGKILVVSNLIKNDDDYELELKETTFSHFMYVRQFKNQDIKSLFSGAYIVTSDNHVGIVLNNMYKGNTFEILNLIGGMAEVEDIENGKYLSEKCLIREVKEELGFDLKDYNYSFELKYLKYPSENENPIGYAIGTIFEIKTKYTQKQIEAIFQNSKHDNEIKNLVFFSKENYKDVYNFEHRKEYIPELLEKVFEDL